MDICSRRAVYSCLPHAEPQPMPADGRRALQRCALGRRAPATLRLTLPTERRARSGCHAQTFLRVNPELSRPAHRVDLRARWQQGAARQNIALRWPAPYSPTIRQALGAAKSTLSSSPPTSGDRQHCPRGAPCAVHAPRNSRRIAPSCRSRALAAHSNSRGRRSPNRRLQPHRRGTSAHRAAVRTRPGARCGGVYVAGDKPTSICRRGAGRRGVL